MHNHPESSQFDAVWHDHGRDPKHPSNPEFPNGIDLDVAGTSHDTCLVSLPYPASRIGVWDIFCQRCGFRAVVTTAGRRDDPRSIKMPCRTL